MLSYRFRLDSFWWVEWHVWFLDILGRSWYPSSRLVHQSRPSIRTTYFNSGQSKPHTVSRQSMLRWLWNCFYVRGIPQTQWYEKDKHFCTVLNELLFPTYLILPVSASYLHVSTLITSGVLLVITWQANGRLSDSGMLWYWTYQGCKISQSL